MVISIKPLIQNESHIHKNHQLKQSIVSFRPLTLSTTLCKVFWEKLRNQKQRLTRPRNFNTWFCVLYECQCKTFINVKESRHSAVTPYSFEILITLRKMVSLNSFDKWWGNWYIWFLILRIKFPFTWGERNVY